MESLLLTKNSYMPTQVCNYRNKHFLWWYWTQTEHQPSYVKTNQFFLNKFFLFIFQIARKKIDSLT